MPRIAPEQLIKCLAILLTPGGGIKSTDEVARLVLLMQRFSKKLVSKCVYVSILKNTELGLLSDFMQHGGWALVFIWLEKAIDAQNQFFIREILDLLMICPVDVSRLKSNDIPKLVKSLSKNNDLGGGVQELAAKIVAKWLAIVKGISPSVEVETSSTNKVEPPPSPPQVDDKVEDEPVPVLKITLKKDGKKLVRSNSSHDDESEGGHSDQSDSSTHKTKVTRSKKSSDTHEKTKSSSHRDTSSRDIDRKHRSDSKHKTISNDKHKPSEHKTSSEKSKSSREKERDKSSKSSSSVTSSSSKNYLKEKERERERERTKKKEKEKDEKDAKLTKIEKDRQIETDQATLARLMVPSINKLGKIPKKTDKAKINELKENIGKPESSVDEKKEKSVVAPAPPPDIPKKNISFSIEKRLPSDQKPKTVKTFNAKFRSTGLEEESVKPPPRAKSSSSSSSSSTKPSSSSSSTSLEKKPVKRPSPSKELPPEKKHKSSDHSSEKSAGSLSPTEKAKATPVPKPKVKVFLQESDVFSSALNDALLVKETKKKKRKLSKDSKDDPKEKENKVSSPTSQKPEESKPSFKFYRDTLDSTLEESKKNTEHEEGPHNETPPTSPTGGNSSPSGNRSPDKTSVRVEKCNIELVSRPPEQPLKGVLSFLKSAKRPKRTVQFKSPEEGLEDVFYFELDETERCNVSRPNSFTDMRSMERELERENFHIARKLTQEDVQSERTVWTGLIPIDVGKISTVVPGKNSREKEIQKARQMTVKPTIYGGYNVIPPSPAEPDFEVHATTDPALMPAEDSSAEPSTFDYSGLPWPEPLNSEDSFYSVPGAPPVNMMPPPTPWQHDGRSAHGHDTTRHVPAQRTSWRSPQRTALWNPQWKQLDGRTWRHFPAGGHASDGRSYAPQHAVPTWYGPPWDGPSDGNEHGHDGRTAHASRDDDGRPRYDDGWSPWIPAHGTPRNVRPWRTPRIQRPPGTLVWTRRPS